MQQYIDLEELTALEGQHEAVRRDLVLPVHTLMLVQRDRTDDANEDVLVGSGIGQVLVWQFE